MSTAYTSIEALYHLFVGSGQKICTDTRKPEAGSIFFALRGGNFNANEFAQKAIEDGCAYAIVDDAKYANGQSTLLVADALTALQDLARYHRDQLKIPVIGITGSNGKTTNKELIHAVLSQKYNTYATKGNLNNHIGVPLSVLSVTPDHEMAVIEMGANHQGEIDFLCHICKPDLGLITNIGKAHLEGFGGEEGVKKGKSELYRYLRTHKGKVFVNGQDPVLMDLAAGNECLCYGDADPSFFVYGQSYQNSDFVEFRWAPQGKTLDESQLIKTNMFGHYNYINLLCAACIGHYFEVSPAAVKTALESYTPEMNRSQVVKTNHNTVILDAYNANPSSMQAAIVNFSRQNSPNKLVILGDMFELGEYAAREHETILELLQTTKMEAILVGPNFYELKNKYNSHLYFEDSEACKMYMKQNHRDKYHILVKGSRGMKLEGLLEVL